MLVAAALTTIVAVAALLVVSKDDSGAGDPRPDRNGPSHYTVRLGDTLTAVADLHGIPVATLTDSLGMTLADSLEPGDVLEIPPIPVEGHEWPHRLAEDPIRAQQNVWFEHWAAEYNVPTALLQALAWYISRWDNTSISGEGDMGIGRIDLELVGWINTDLIAGDTRVDPRSPEGNVALMAAYLGHLLDLTGGDHANAVATYYLDRETPSEASWDIGLRSVVTGVLARVPAFEATPPAAATTTTTTTAPD